MKNIKMITFEKCACLDPNQWETSDPLYRTRFDSAVGSCEDLLQTFWTDAAPNLSVTVVSFHYAF